MGTFRIVKDMLFGPSPVQALVSIFYTPPTDDDPTSNLKVLLLPRNTVLREVLKKRRELNEEEIYIDTPLCKLTPNQEYTLSTSPQDDSIIIQPDRATFEVDESSYHNYTATFDVDLEERFKNVLLLLRDSNTSVCVWKCNVGLSLRKQHTLSLPAEDKLFSIRSSFINIVSPPILNNLLDRLLEKGVIIKEEYDEACVKPVKHKKARFVIDTVMSKGTAACSYMILILCEVDPSLSKDIGLFSMLTNEDRKLEVKKQIREEEEASSSSSVSTQSKSTTILKQKMDPSPLPRKRHRVSERWSEKLEKLRNTDEGDNIDRVGNVVFGTDDEFRIAEGSGGTEVFLGLRDDGTEVAVKRMTKKNCEVLKNKEVFLRLEELDDDPSIVRYVGYEDDKYFGYLVLQLCEYTLEEHIKNTSDSEKFQLAKQVLKGLKLLHCQDPPILHRDIKPQNVLIDIRGRAKLADFGISRRLLRGQTTHSTTSAGTKCWKAKETLNDSDDNIRVKYKRSTDIQVAGMLLYYILSGGQHPFGDNLHCEINISKGKEGYNLDHVQDVLAKELIERMINEDPKKRPKVKECLAHPYFWSDKRRVDFLIQVGNEKEVQNYNNVDEKFIRRLEQCDEKGLFTTWKHKLPADVVQKMNPKNYSENGFGLLRFIRNFNVHAKDAADFDLLKTFPGLLLSVYMFTKAEDWNKRTTLKTYFWEYEEAESKASDKMVQDQPDMKMEEKPEREPPSGGGCEGRSMDTPSSSSSSSVSTIEGRKQEEKKQRREEEEASSSSSVSTQSKGTKPEELNQSLISTPAAHQDPENQSFHQPVAPQLLEESDNTMLSELHTDKKEQPSGDGCEGRSMDTPSSSSSSSVSTSEGRKQEEKKQIREEEEASSSSSVSTQSKGTKPEENQSLISTPAAHQDPENQSFHQPVAPQLLEESDNTMLSELHIDKKEQPSGDGCEGRSMDTPSSSSSSSVSTSEGRKQEEKKQIREEEEASSSSSVSTQSKGTKPEELHQSLISTPAAHQDPENQPVAPQVLEESDNTMSESHTDKGTLPKGPQDAAQE